MCNIKFRPSYDTNSYVFVNDKIKLNVECDFNDKLKWISSNELIATVDNGVVFGVSEGIVDIKVLYENELWFTFGVSVFSSNKREVIIDLLKNHNSNIFVRKNLEIDGKNGYKANIYESVNKLLFNSPLIINDDYLNKGNEKWKKDWNENLQSIEFITVHYTGNVNCNANAEVHAKYFVNPNEPTSIHYTTGNDGVFLCLDNDKRAAHAGDSAGPVFEWLDTGVLYDGTSIDKVSVSVSDDFYFVINGKKSLIKLPETYTYKGRNTKHLYSGNGYILLEGTDKLIKAEEKFNKMGFAFIVKDNRYHMSTTWWCYTQVYDGAICNVGGNRNSIGIESSINEGSDLWYTWQKTAQLVALLMKENNLDINRVKGHHFYTAKNCPQPMIENDMEIWNKFIDLVKAEYLFITKYTNYEFELISNDISIMNTGRIKEVNNDVCINYKIVIKEKDSNKVEEISLYSIVNNLNIIQ